MNASQIIYLEPFLWAM